LFPFWTTKQIRRIISSLEEQGAIVTGNYNTSTYDRTSWYAMGDSLLLDGKVHLGNEKPYSTTSSTICPNGQVHLPKRADRFAQTGECIIGTNNKPDNKQEIDKEESDDSLRLESPTDSPKPKKQRKTTEEKCLFEDSRYYDFDLFAKEFDNPDFSGIDIKYYYESVRDWSSSSGAKKKDWIATARSFIRKDDKENKLIRKSEAVAQVDNQSAFEQAKERQEKQQRQMEKFNQGIDEDYVRFCKENGIKI
jgi:hypothetical protein